MKKILFFLFAAVLAAGGVEAQEAVDSMKIFYRRGYRNVDLMGRVFRCTKEYSRSSTVRCDNATS